MKLKHYLFNLSFIILIGSFLFAQERQKTSVSKDSIKIKPIVEILKTYQLFIEGKKLIREKFNFEFDYLVELKKFRREIFGENLEQQLFPPNPADKIILFYAYSDKYLLENKNLPPAEKKIHIAKKREEIYSNDFDNLVSIQSFEQEFSLQRKILERELEIMNPVEKSKVLEEIRESISP